jgi:hypothetical protein
MAGGDMKDDPHGPLYSVVCTDTNPYGDWQTRFLEHTWVESGMPGELLRLVGAPADDPMPVHTSARVVHTSATNTHPQMDVPYAGMNRLLSLREWLDNERPVGTVLILDCDFVFRSPIHLRAEPGSPICQDWFRFGLGEKLIRSWDALTSVDRTSIQGVTWPLLIHTSDLRPMMPRWIDLTVQLRAATGGWESDMFAFVIALAERGLTSKFETLGAWMDWPEDVVAGAPIIHYCQPVLDADGERLWYKQDYRPWEPLGIDPQAAAFDYCRDFLEILNRFVSTKQATLEA